MDKKAVISLKSYKQHKLKILNQCGITTTPEIVNHLLSLKTEIAIDNYCHDLIVNDN